MPVPEFLDVVPRIEALRKPYFNLEQIVRWQAT
jgi:hypothetical protein